MSLAHRLLIIILAISLVVVTLVTGCISKQQIFDYSYEAGVIGNPDATPRTVEGFQTYHFALAEKETNFKIVRPGYVPSNLEQTPLILGTPDASTPIIWYDSVQTDKSNKWKVELIYYPTDSDYLPRYVSITQNRCVKLATPPDYKIEFSPKPSYEILNIDGLRITYFEITCDLTTGPDEIAEVTGFNFLWIQNNMFIDVESVGYSFNESTKVIQSMIRD